MTTMQPRTLEAKRKYVKHVNTNKNKLIMPIIRVLTSTIFKRSMKKVEENKRQYTDRKIAQALCSAINTLL
jgi:hypothetical protein